MQKLMKNDFVRKLFVLVFCLPIYCFVMVGEAYSSSHFTFIGKSTSFWLEFISYLSGKDIYSQKIENKYYNRKQMNRQIKHIRNNSFISDDYKSRIVALMKDVKKHGYGVYDAYFDEKDKHGDFHLCFIRNGFSFETHYYFVLNPENTHINMYKGDSDYGYKDIVFETPPTEEDVVPFLLENVN